MNLTSKLESQPIDPEAMTVAEAQSMYRIFRVTQGWKPHTGARLLSWANENAKFAKTTTKVVGLSLAPAKTSTHNVCVSATSECKQGCVSFAGRGELPNVQRGRVTKTQFLAEHPQAFVTLVWHELQLAIKRHPTGVKCRLNAFSDLAWETIAPKLFDLDVEFYDYTKRPGRMGNTPPNYHLTYSVSEKPSSLVRADHFLRQGHNVAVVFDVKRGADLPALWRDAWVLDGDKSDDRTTDPAGWVVGLRAKGRMTRGTWRMVKPVPVQIGVSPSVSPSVSP